MTLYYRFTPIIVKQQIVPSKLKSVISFAASLSHRVNKLHGRRRPWGWLPLSLRFLFQWRGRWLYYVNQKKCSISCLGEAIERKTNVRTVKQTYLRASVFHQLYIITLIWQCKFSMKGYVFMYTGLAQVVTGGQRETRSDMSAVASVGIETAGFRVVRYTLPLCRFLICVN